MISYYMTGAGSLSSSALFLLVENHIYSFLLGPQTWHRDRFGEACSAATVQKELESTTCAVATEPSGSTQRKRSPYTPPSDIQHP